MTLIEFLLARIAEDEAAARDAQQEGAYLHYADTAAEECVEMAKREGCAPEGYRYLRRWLPERVLVECAAKRRIVEAAGGWLQNEPDPPQWAVFVMQTLALPYADHPDYREEWKP